MIAYKLLRVRADGSLGPLFINARQRIPMDTWLQAECHPTKGFAVRPGWHCTLRPHAPHLGMKGRRWFRVEVAGVTTFERPGCQGGTWLLAERMRVIEAIESTTRLLPIQPSKAA
jgi:hypothetical protein